MTCYANDRDDPKLACIGIPPSCEVYEDDDDLRWRWEFEFQSQNKLLPCRKALARDWALTYSLIMPFRGR